MHSGYVRSDLAPFASRSLAKTRTIFEPSSGPWRDKHFSEGSGTTSQDRAGAPRRLDARRRCVFAPAKRSPAEPRETTRADGVLLHRPPPPPREGGRGCRGGHARLVPGSSECECSADSGGVPGPGDADAAPCACRRTPVAAGSRARRVDARTGTRRAGRAARRRLGRGPAAARGLQRRRTPPRFRLGARRRAPGLQRRRTPPCWRRAGPWATSAAAGRHARRRETDKASAGNHAGRAADRGPRCRGRLRRDAAAAAHAHAVGRRERDRTVW